MQALLSLWNTGSVAPALCGLFGIAPPPPSDMHPAPVVMAAAPPPAVIAG
ncbi:hypothetical protein Y88_3741 [Novosphingobium nitrogenifigens DSM 19370]|uniref:Uncharacterized protein n=1 Tax=Novosphingobium nitrogenifigens DSM 19370 TaxID=983920 RepID=F1ZDC7_9SPHN|nr:hypothetical protein Y88_3741 [Novosphingobium nitrogenifigens DSM 19370]